MVISVYNFRVGKYEGYYLSCSNNSELMWKHPSVRENIYRNYSDAGNITKKKSRAVGVVNVETS